MTKSAITRERLEKINSWRETYGAGSNVMLPAEEAEELARIALAAMDSEPVAYTEKHEISNMHATGLYLRAWPADRARNAVEGYTIPLYRHAQPAPEYPETLPCPVLLEPGLRFGKGIKTSTMLAALARRAVHESDMAALSPEERAEFQAGIEDFKSLIAQQPVVPDEKPMPNSLSMYAVDAVAAIAEVRGWNACRGAMLQELQKSAGTEAICRGNENAQALNTIKAPPALGSLPKTGEVQNTNSPVIPDGYVMVPKEPTDEMIAAAMNCEDVLFNSDDSFCVQFGNIYEAMLAAAPQSPGGDHATVPGKWIPVSERMPEDEQEVLTINKMGHRFVSFFDKHSGLFFDRLDAPAACCIEHVLVTHWMPLPAAPQEVTNGK
ncbi:Eaa1 [Klebsiella pneumoniae]|nr:DUF551 domain-containing protein [Klebsiella pneumoniae]SWZ69644.1 Eaa1 [Klebsiella pneumoniae]